MHVGKLGRDFHEGAVLDAFLHDERKVVGAGEVAVGMEAGGVGELGVDAAKLEHALVHADDKCAHIARHMLGQRIGHFVGGGQKKRIHALAKHHLFSAAHADIGGIRGDRDGFGREFDNVLQRGVFQGE